MPDIAPQLDSIKLWLTAHWSVLAETIVGMLLIWCAVFTVTQLVHRLRIRHEYGVNVPLSIRVRHLHPTHPIGVFMLGYPQWNAPKRDGTRDRRTNDMSITKNKSILDIGKWQLQGRNPFVFYDLITDMRDRY